MIITTSVSRENNVDICFNIYILKYVMKVNILFKNIPIRIYRDNLK